MSLRLRCFFVRALLLVAFASVVLAAGAPGGSWPLPLEAYPAPGAPGLLATLRERGRAEPFNLVATLLFGLAIVHTFLAPKFRAWAHAVETAHARRRQRAPRDLSSEHEEQPQEEVSFAGQMLHFLGEVEAVFGAWAVVLFAAIAVAKGWGRAVHYIGEQVNFTEAMFVVVIMALASTRPVLMFAERCLRGLAGLGGGTVAAWWLALLIVAPLLGSFITEPAAMTIAALLLARQFYVLRPSPRFAYATLGLLFVNVSVGGTLTHFAAPPVLMVAAPWRWNTAYMLAHFGWKAVAGIVVATLLYYVAFRREFARLDAERKSREVRPAEQARAARRVVPGWITAVQLGFVALTVFFAHDPALFVGTFLFFLAFAQATAHHQSRLDLRGPLLVGFFLAGLVIHGGLQGWWIEPVLRGLGATPLFAGATLLTAVNDNAAITYLATLVPGFTEQLKYAVVAGAVTGGGLTVIANAPNPAGQAILGRFFPEGVSPVGLCLGALPATGLMAAAFLLL
jgi:Na+/H+ antiporter NhaD/arsenite permease-like protein